MSGPNRELADFLRRARSQVDPQRAGLPADSRVRRVPGLRREEVARLAQVSTDYYTRLEQGRPIIPSLAVVEAITRALELDEAGHQHLIHLIGTTSTRARRPTSVPRARPGLHQLLGALHSTPALLLGRRTEVLGINRLARALLADFNAMPAKQRSYARWLFLDPEARERLIDWEVQARAVVENLRFDSGRDPDDPVARALVHDLTAASPEFERWWKEHHVYQRTFGDKRFRHPVVGELTLQYETLQLPGDPDQTLYLYTAEARSRSAQVLDLLISWTLDAERTAPDGQQSART